MHRASAPTRHPPSRAAAQHAASPRVPQGNGTSRLDSHPAQRTAPVIPTGRLHPR